MNRILTILLPILLLLSYGCSHEDTPTPPDENTEETENSGGVYFHVIKIDTPLDLFTNVDSKILSEYASGERSVYLYADSFYSFSRRPEDSEWEGHNMDHEIGGPGLTYPAYIHGGKFYIPVTYSTFSNGWCFVCLWTTFKKVTGIDWAAYIIRTLNTEFDKSNPLFFKEDESLIQTLDSEHLAFSDPTVDFGHVLLFDHSFYHVTDNKIEIEDSIISGITGEDLKKNILKRCRTVFGDFIDLDSIYSRKHEHRYIDLRNGYKFADSKE